MMMNKEQAIKLLHTKKQELDKDEFDPFVWIDALVELLKKIFPLSFDSKRESIEDIDFDINIAAGQELRVRHRNRGKNRAKKYIDSFIQEIDDHGMEIKPHQGDVEDSTAIFLLKSKTFWIVLMTAVGTSFSLGMYLGNNRFDNDKIRLYESLQEEKSDNKVLIDSIAILNQRLLNKASELD